MPFALNLFFRGVDGQGWSQLWYTRYVTYDDALTNAENLAKKLLPVLSDDTTINYVRASDVSIRDDAIVSPLNLEGTFAGSAAPTWQARRYRVSAGTTYRRFMHIQGLPAGVDDAFRAGGNPKLTEWLSKVKPLLNFIKASAAAGGLSLKVLLRGTDNPDARITAIAPTVGNDGYVITFGPAIPTGPILGPDAGPIVQGNFLRIYNVREFPALQGKFLVTAATSTTVTIAFASATAFAYKGKSRGQKYGIAYLPITDITDRGIAKAPVGRPFGLLPGRRRRRRVATT